MQPLTTSIYNFPDLIEGGYLYVDKTAGIYDLVREYKAQYFLSRPRRFGKSLLVSTLRAIFEGRRELFEGLAIADTDYDWTVYPVIQLDLGSVGGRTAEEVEEDLLRKVKNNADRLEVQLLAGSAYQAFDELIQSFAAQGQKVVILVDEYDKPLLNHLGEDSAREIQQVLKSFYAVIKTTEAAQRFVLLTGVSKFSQVSVFSDLNNLTDLTMDRKAATLLGYTQEELEHNFPEYIAALAEEQGTDVPGVLPQIREWYNGYRFEENAETVYNPVSVMKCFQNRKFRNYWFETGTPSFLLKILRTHPLSLGNLEAPEMLFSVYDPLNLEVLPLLVQTGYLTIQGYHRDGMIGRYRLGYPNAEVEQAFSYWLAVEYTDLPAQNLDTEVGRLRASLDANQLPQLFESLRCFFAGIPYDLVQQREAWYQTLFYSVFKLLGAEISVEVHNNRGRVDAVVKTATHIYVFEFKLTGTAQEALDQIREKGYAEPFTGDGRKVVCVGVAFDPETRNLGEWLSESAG